MRTSNRTGDSAPQEAPSLRLVICWLILMVRPGRLEHLTKCLGNNLAWNEEGGRQQRDRIALNRTCLRTIDCHRQERCRLASHLLCQGFRDSKNGAVSSTCRLSKTTTLSSRKKGA